MNEAAVQRAQAYFERLMKNPHRWIRITCKKGNRQDRRDTYHMIKHMLDLAGIKYRLPAKLDHYTIMYAPDPVMVSTWVNMHTLVNTYTFPAIAVHDGNDAAIAEIGQNIHRQIQKRMMDDTMAIWNGSATWKKTN